MSAPPAGMGAAAEPSRGRAHDEGLEKQRSAREAPDGGEGGGREGEREGTGRDGGERGEGGEVGEESAKLSTGKDLAALQASAHARVLRTRGAVGGRDKSPLQQASAEDGHLHSTQAGGESSRRLYMLWLCTASHILGMHGYFGFSEVLHVVACTATHVLSIYSCFGLRTV